MRRAGSGNVRRKFVSKGPAILMTLHFDIPESITSSLRLPEPEMEPRLRAELGVALYAQSILPFGKASELAGISRHGFADAAGTARDTASLHGAGASSRPRICSRLAIPLPSRTWPRSAASNS